MTYTKNTGHNYMRGCFSKGFTLVELLVVVLIIGILAAVALPLYQKTVIKARAMQGIVIIQSMWQAQKLYILANGTRAEKLADLDVTIPTEYKEWTFNLDGNTIQARNWILTKTGDHQSARYTLLMLASSRSPQIFCKSSENNICEILSGGEIGNPPGYGGTWYIVQ